MALLNEVQKSNSDVESYVSQLDAVLLQKIKALVDLRHQVFSFHKHLKTEE